jgi:hypothetical protein
MPSNNDPSRSFYDSIVPQDLKEKLASPAAPTAAGSEEPKEDHGHSCSMSKGSPDPNERFAEEICHCGLVFQASGEEALKKVYEASKLHYDLMAAPVASQAPKPDCYCGGKCCEECGGCLDTGNHGISCSHNPSNVAAAKIRSASFSAKGIEMEGFPAKDAPTNNTPRTVEEARLESQSYLAEDDPTPQTKPYPELWRDQLNNPRFPDATGGTAQAASEGQEDERVCSVCGEWIYYDNGDCTFHCGHKSWTWKSKYKAKPVDEPMPYRSPTAQAASEGQEKKVCVDCRDLEANIRGWIEQLGGDSEAKYCSWELERLIDNLTTKPTGKAEGAELPPRPVLFANDPTKVYIDAIEAQRDAALSRVTELEKNQPRELTFAELPKEERGECNEAWQVALEFNEENEYAFRAGWNASRKATMVEAAKLLRTDGVLLTIVPGETKQDYVIRFALKFAEKLEEIADHEKAHRRA